MVLDFSKFQAAVAVQFDRMSQTGNLFCTLVEKDDMWNHYLESFPEGSNPVYRERTEHDCSCCKQFIRAVGNVVSILPDGRLVSIWDVETGIDEYDAVARSMSQLAKNAAIDNQFLSPVRHIGTAFNYEDDNGTARKWEHFGVQLPARRNTGKDFYKSGPEIGPALSDSRATHDVFLRGLREFTLDTIDTLLEAIDSIYRGNEYKHAVEGFRKLKVNFDKLPETEQDLFAWANIDSVPGIVSRIRNTGIGTLLIDLESGIDLEDAVRKFETSIMAPTNYKRPTALVSKAMVAKAQATVEELGLTSALERRYAQLADITINNIIFADRSIKPRLGGKNPFEDVANKIATPKNFDRLDSMPIERFIKDVIPKAHTIEVMLENKHGGNLVSLVAPQHASAGRLFKWDNNFSWAYNGDVADSIKERVKQAGGNVTGDLCCRLAWNNYDDLDLHMTESDNNYEIYYGNKRQRSPSGGMLDVDANAGGGGRGHGSRTPVENIFYASQHTMRPGRYTLFVNQFAKVESDNVGFEIEIDWLGEVRKYSYAKAVRQKENILVAHLEFNKSNKLVFAHEGLASTSASRELWGLKSNEFHKVNVLMNSPNYWDGEKGNGNKHYFFMLDRCTNDGQVRPFFNEFLRGELDKHRKVIEIVGNKMKVAPASGQLSGIGFSDTIRSEIIVRVKGSVSRILKVLI